LPWPFVLLPGYRDCENINCIRRFQTGVVLITVVHQRFKDEIKPMDKASEAILALRPVTFRYKKEIDAAGTSQFELVAEEVEKVNRDLVVRDKEGKPYTVRYDAVNAMLLNEFLKEHRKVEQQEATIRQLRKDFEATVAQLTTRLDEQAAQIQKVSAQLAAASPPGGRLEAGKFATGPIRGGRPCTASSQQSVEPCLLDPREFHLRTP
jgi:hypothetical protein